MKTRSLLFSATALLLATAVPASAATLLYSFAPTTAGTQRFSFNVDSNPTVTGVTPFQFNTNVQNLTVGGVVQTGVRSFTFYTSGGDGGLENTQIVGAYLGPQLFSGQISTPTLLTGTFSLFGGPGGAAGTLTVSTVAPIPEPATWAMMMIGFGLAGAAIRRRKVATRVTYGAIQA
jgi:hypothetical protein